MGGYAGAQRTITRITGTFFWPNLHNTVLDFIVHCATCQLVKSFNKAPQGLLQPLPILGKIWDAISMYFVTHLPPSSGKSTILVVINRLSKQAHFSAMGLQFIA